MNVDLRLEYRQISKSKIPLSENKDSYLAWLEDELTKQRDVVKNLTIPVISQQSELLCNFDKWLEEHPQLKDLPTDFVWNTFKLHNCG